MKNYCIIFLMFIGLASQLLPNISLWAGSVFALIMSFILLAYGASISTMITQTIVFLFILYAFYGFKLLLSLRQSSLESSLNQLMKRMEGLKQSHEVLQHECVSLNKTLKKKESLYEGLKGMNQTLEFSEMLVAFSSLLSEITSFEKGWLITLDIKPDEIHNVYQLMRNSPPIQKNRDVKTHDFQSQLSLYERVLIKRDIVYTNAREKSPVKEAHSSPIAEGTRMGIPIKHENKMIGVLILEGYENKDLEDIEILCIQLAMQIKKTNLYQEVRRLSIIDGLTQVYLRRHLLKLIENELERLDKLNRTCSLLMVDIDYFKHANDEYGHLAGDVLLRDLSNVIQLNLRQIDIMGRYGGEEFLIALPEASKEEAIIIAERFRKDIISREFESYGKIIRLSVSTGIATFPEDSKDLKTLIQLADQALYQAKNQGRNKVIAYKSPA
ncbi:MAG: diguanylate cyclase [Chlamydiota bacterium]|nr:diguanylate cyclase [Chlamydiota bacterium]